LTTADKILLALLIASIIISFISARGMVDRGSGVLVEIDHRPVHMSHLDQDELFTVQGDRGELVLEVSQQRVRVVRSDCPNQICVRTGWRSKAGDIIVCVPNRAVIRISGTGKEGGVEAVTG